MDNDGIGGAFEKTLRDWGSWDYWIESISNEKDLPADTRHAVLLGLADLRRIFGEDWLREAVRARHPILQNFVNRAPWTRWWFSEIAGMLRDFARIQGFEQLRRRLASSEEYTGALAELYTAHRVKVAGFQVALSPVVEKAAPDILVYGPQRVYIEVSVPRRSEERRRAKRVGMSLGFAAIGDNDVAGGGEIHQNLPERLRRKYETMIKEAIERVKETGEPVEIHDPGIVDFYFVPKANSELVARWRSEGKLLQVTGPPIRSFELLRLMRTLRAKANQLPKDAAGVIMLHDTYASLETPLKVIAYELDDILQAHSHVIQGGLYLNN